MGVGNYDACRRAIDRYFAERNRAFLEHPRRAGKKIWGKERVEAVFREENNCKDPRGGNQFEPSVFTICELHPCNA